MPAHWSIPRKFIFFEKYIEVMRSHNLDPLKTGSRALRAAHIRTIQEEITSEQEKHLLRDFSDDTKAINFIKNNLHYIFKLLSAKLLSEEQGVPPRISNDQWNALLDAEHLLHNVATSRATRQTVLDGIAKSKGSWRSIDLNESVTDKVTLPSIPGAVGYKVVANGVDISDKVSYAMQEDTLASTRTRAIFNMHPTVILCGFSRAYTADVVARYNGCLNIIVRHLSSSLLNTIAERPDVVSVYLSPKILQTDTLKYLCNKLDTQIETIKDLKEDLTDSLDMLRTLVSAAKPSNDKVPTRITKHSSISGTSMEYFSPKTTKKEATPKRIQVPKDGKRKTVIIVEPIPAFDLKDLRDEFSETFCILQAELRTVDLIIRKEKEPLLMHSSDLVLPRVSKALDFSNGNLVVTSLGKVAIAEKLKELINN